MSEEAQLHPLVARMSDLLVRGTEEPWALPANAEAIIAGELSKLNGTPELADGVISLFHAAIALSEEEGSPAAAAVVFRALMSVKSELKYPGNESLDRQLDAALERTTKRAPHVGEKAPEGSVKPAALDPTTRRFKP